MVTILLITAIFQKGLSKIKVQIYTRTKSCP